MDIDAERLQKFVDSLSEDQKKLIRESLGGVAHVDPHQLGQSLSSKGSVDALHRVAAVAANAGTANAGTTAPREPPLTRW